MMLALAVAALISSVTMPGTHSAAPIRSASPAPALAVLRGRADGLVPAVPGRIYGHPMWFDIDTGALESFVDLSAARALRLRSLGTAAVKGAGAGQVAAVRLDALAIRLGDTTFVARKALAVDLSHAGSSLPQGGILGFDFFSRYVVQIDFDSYRVTLYNPKTYRYVGSGSAIPLIVRAPRAFVRVTVSAEGVKPETHVLRLDLGSSDAVDDDIVLRSSAPKHAISAGVGIGKRFTAYLGTVGKLQIGPFTLHDLPAATGGVQLIGDTVWHRFNIVIDFSRSVMYLSPRTRL